MKRLVMMTLATACVLVSCRGGDDSPASTTSSLATSQIASATGETTQPLDLNNRSISDADTDDLSSPAPVN